MSDVVVMVGQLELTSHRFEDVGELTNVVRISPKKKELVEIELD